MTKEFIAEGNGRLVNAELAEEVLPYAQWTMKTLWALRLLLLIFSFKHRKLIRVVFYVQFLFQISQAFLPVDVGSL